MADDFAEHLLRSTLALMCKAQGWHTASHLSLLVFSKIARYYLRNIGLLTLRYSLHSGRYEPSLHDLAQTFSELGIALSDLQTFWSETDSHSGAPQVCKFPVEAALNLQENAIQNPPHYVPDYLPSFVTAETTSVQDTTVKEETTVVESSVEPSTDPFDEAAAAPAPANFPFINKDELPEPKMSSWGFQRVTIDSKPTILSPTSEKRVSKTSPDNFIISENSDDFVFASKHSKSKEDNKKKVSPEKPPPPIENNHISDKKHDNNESVLNESVFEPSLGTSTPLNIHIPHAKQIPENGTVNCKQLFPNTSNLTTIQEEFSGFVPECTPVCPKTPDLNNRSGSPLDFGTSSFDELTSKDSFEKLLKTLSPTNPKVVDKAPSVRLKSASPPNKRRKLDKPQVVPNDDRKLLKNCPDLMKDDKVVRIKTECRLANNHHAENNHHSKPNNVHSFEKIKLSIKTPKNLHHKSKKIKENSSEKYNENHRSKKSKRDKTVKAMDLFKDSTISLSDKPIKQEVVIPKPILSNNMVCAVTNNHTEPKVSPITLSLGKKDAKSEVRIEKARSISVEPAKSDIPSLKVKLKTLNKTSKYKSKKIIEKEDDLSSLSSDSLDGFEDLLPKNNTKTKKSSASNRCMVKTKAELKNPCPVSPAISPVPSPAPPPEKKRNITTKIKIAKPASASSSPSYPSVTVPHKTSVKLKLPLPPPPPQQPDMSDHSKSAYSETSLRIDESYVSNKSLSVMEPKPAPLKIPKIKIKIGGSHLSDLPTSEPSTPRFSSPEAPVRSPVPPAIKSLKFKITDPASLDRQEVKEKSKSEKPKLEKPKVEKPKSEKPKSEKPKSEKPKSEKPKMEKPKSEKPKIKKPKETKATKSSKAKSMAASEVVKKEKVAKVKEKVPDTIPPIPEVPLDRTPTESTSLESTLISETVVSETVVLEPIKIWYCPTCMLPDDGSPMVGCDTCDEWYHWPCVGLTQAPPDNVDWYCPPCVKKTKSQKKVGKRKRKT